MSASFEPRLHLHRHAGRLCLEGSAFRQLGSRCQLAGHDRQDGERGAGCEECGDPGRHPGHSVVVTGTGQSASLTLSGQTALAGSFNTGTLTAAYGDSLTIRSGGSLAAKTGTLNANAYINGTLSVSGSLTLASPTSFWVSGSGAKASLGSLMTSAAVDVFNGGKLQV